MSWFNPDRRFPHRCQVDCAICRWLVERKLSRRPWTQAKFSEGKELIVIETAEAKVGQ